MILAFISNDALGSVANARALAQRQWPGEAVEVRNPGRVRGEVETKGVTAVVVAGEHPHLVQQYRRAGLPVATVKVVQEVPVGLSLADAMKAELARAMCRLPEGKLCALIRAVSDMPFLRSIAGVECEQPVPRAVVLQAIADKKEWGEE